MSLFIYLGYFWLTVGIFNERASYCLLKWCGNSHESIIVLSSDGVSGLLFCLCLSSHWKHSYSTTHVILITCLTSPYFSTMPWHIFQMFFVVVAFMGSPEKHTAILCLISLLFFQWNPINWLNPDTFRCLTWVIWIYIFINSCHCQCHDFKTKIISCCDHEIYELYWLIVDSLLCKCKCTAILWLKLNFPKLTGKVYKATFCLVALVRIVET